MKSISKLIQRKSKSNSRYSKYFSPFENPKLDGSNLQNTSNQASFDDIDDTNPNIINIKV